MKLKRNAFLPLVVMALAFVLAACSNIPASTGPSFAASEVESSAGPAGAETEAPAKTENKILIAYFSFTGNTEEAAQKIADYTGGDLAEIQRAEEYSDLQEEAEEEILNGTHPEITVSLEDLGAYDTVFVGYPIWWDEAPAMIATFLASNDFSGKTVIPFCTSASDDIGNSLHIFEELCPDAELAEGLTANDLNDIEPWLQRLGVMGDSGYESAEGTQIKMITDNTETVITLNGSRAAADLAAMLPLELTLIERNSFAKGMTLPERLSSEEATTREYEIGDFGYWDAGPDLAIFYDDIYEQTIVEVIPLGHAETGAEAVANETGTVRLELMAGHGE